MGSRPTLGTNFVYKNRKRKTAQTMIRFDSLAWLVCKFSGNVRVKSFFKIFAREGILVGSMTLWPLRKLPVECARLNTRQILRLFSSKVELRFEAPTMTLQNCQGPPIYGERRSI